MDEMTRQKFLKLLAAGGASFLGAQRLLSGQTPDQQPVSQNANESVDLNGVSPTLQQLTAQPKRGPYSPWARLKYTCRGNDDDDWNVHPNGDLNLIDVIREESTANVRKHWNVADITNLDSMTIFPFLFMHSELAPELEDAHRKNVREYLLRGGFLFAEDCVKGKMRSDGSGDEFFRRMAEVDFPAMFPEGKLEKLPFDHPVFHCFHHFDKGLPHMQGKEWGLHGLTVKGRLVALLSPSDLHCGWANGKEWFSEEKQQQAFHMGTNIYLYAMTQDTGGKIAAS
ncbi:MAG TPA: DUF4159 domain-containing protein [Chthoniobacteraceae bacterium]|nr:DUF4159 domain-containing protein [Chthoniobacteraceae bacterium]